jgi:hypothetical protein
MDGIKCVRAVVFQAGCVIASKSMALTHFILKETGQKPTPMFLRWELGSRSNLNSFHYRLFVFKNMLYSPLEVETATAS